MNKNRTLYFVLAILLSAFFVLIILLGAFMFVYGEFDDSPGGQVIGLIVGIIGIVGLIKGIKKISS